MNNMALTPQDPANPSIDANTYISAADARARAVLLGVELSDDDTELEASLFQALQYVDSFDYQGVAVEPLQSTDFPRSGMVINNNEYPSDIIPQPVIDAQIISAAAIGEGEEVFSNTNGQRIAEERVEGAVDVKYFNTDDSGEQQNKVVMGRVYALLKPFLDDSVDGGYWNYGLATAV